MGERRSTTLRRKLHERRALVAPGCHDALSARVIADAGFEAVQVSGFGVSGAMLAQPDVGLVRMKENLDLTWHIVHAAGVPVMADADTGGGNALNAAGVTERLIVMGAAGMNLEDQQFPKRCGHMVGKEVISAEEMAGKIRACADVRDRLDPDFVLNARTDAYATHGFDEALRRCRVYLAAGADMVFIDAIGTREDIGRAVGELGCLVSVNLMDGVTGVKTQLIPIPELAAMGVARVSIPVASILIAPRALTDFSGALTAAPDGVLPEATDQISAFDDYTRCGGLDQYREQEDTYLPRTRVAEKYGLPDVD